MIFKVTNEQLSNLMNFLDKDIRNGLGRETNSSSVVKSYITYVQDLPNGKGKNNSDDYMISYDNRCNLISFFLSERGRFLALDLGGTNFRVLLIKLRNDKRYKVKSKVFQVPTKIQTGKGTEVIKYSFIIN